MLVCQFIPGLPYLHWIIVSCRIYLSNVPVDMWRVWSQNVIKAKVKKLSYSRENIDGRDRVDRKIQPRFHLFAKCDISNRYIAFWKQMEVGLYFPVYRRCFRGGNSFFSLWHLSRFVTKFFMYTSKSLELSASHDVQYVISFSNPSFNSRSHFRMRRILCMDPQKSVCPHFANTHQNLHVKTLISLVLHWYLVTCHFQYFPLDVLT